MDISGRTALVTGANRGLGRHLAQQLRDRGASVYAGARNPGAIDIDGVTPIAIDLTDPASVTAAAAATENVSILVNNAGSLTKQGLLTGDLDDIALEMDTHYFGTLRVARAFAPQLAEHAESSMANILSVLSWISSPAMGAYCAAKSAAWSLTNALRQELIAQGTRVAGLYVGYMDTDMAAGVDASKHDPAQIATQALDGIADGSFEIVTDEISHQVQAGLAGGVAALYPDLATVLSAR